MNLSCLSLNSLNYKNAQLILSTKEDRHLDCSICYKDHIIRIEEYSGYITVKKNCKENLLELISLVPYFLFGLKVPRFLSSLTILFMLHIIALKSNEDSKDYIEDQIEKMKTGD